MGTALALARGGVLGRCNRALWHHQAAVRRAASGAHVYRRPIADAEGGAGKAHGAQSAQNQPCHPSCSPCIAGNWRRAAPGHCRRVLQGAGLCATRLLPVPVLARLLRWQGPGDLKDECRRWRTTLPIGQCTSAPAIGRRRRRAAGGRRALHEPSSTPRAPIIDALPTRAIHTVHTSTSTSTADSMHIRGRVRRAPLRLRRRRSCRSGSLAHCGLWVHRVQDAQRSQDTLCRPAAAECPPRLQSGPLSRTVTPVNELALPSHRPFPPPLAFCPALPSKL